MSSFEELLPNRLNFRLIILTFLAGCSVQLTQPSKIHSDNQEQGGILCNEATVLEQRLPEIYCQISTEMYEAILSGKTLVLIDFEKSVYSPGDQRGAAVSDKIIDAEIRNIETTKEGSGYKLKGTIHTSISGGNQVNQINTNRYRLGYKDSDGSITIFSDYKSSIDISTPRFNAWKAIHTKDQQLLQSELSPVISVDEQSTTYATTISGREITIYSSSQDKPFEKTENIYIEMGSNRDIETYLYGKNLYISVVNDVEHMLMSYNIESGETRHISIPSLPNNLSTLKGEHYGISFFSTPEDLFISGVTENNHPFTGTIKESKVDDIKIHSNIEVHSSIAFATQNGLIVASARGPKKPDFYSSLLMHYSHEERKFNPYPNPENLSEIVSGKVRITPIPMNLEQDQDGISAKFLLSYTGEGGLPDATDDDFESIRSDSPHFGVLAIYTNGDVIRSHWSHDGVVPEIQGAIEEPYINDFDGNGFTETLIYNVGDRIFAIRTPQHPHEVIQKVTMINPPSKYTNLILQSTITENLISDSTPNK